VDRSSHAGCSSQPGHSSQAGRSEGVAARTRTDYEHDQELGGGGGSEGCEGSAAARATTNRKNFVPNEERQLTRSVLVISQDPICGNQQKSSAFWERIFLHYDECRPGGFRPARSLESKWGLIKHDVS
jgi:hypothetical protein